MFSFNDRIVDCIIREHFRKNLTKYMTMANWRLYDVVVPERFLVFPCWIVFLFLKLWVKDILVVSFSLLTLSQAFCNVLKTILILLSCSSIVLPWSRASSKIVLTPWIFFSTSGIYLWNISGAGVIPKSNLLNQYFFFLAFHSKQDGCATST